MDTMEKKEEKYFSYLLLVIFLLMFLHSAIKLIFLSEHVSMTMKTTYFLSTVVFLLGILMIYIRSIKGITLKSTDKGLVKIALIGLYCLCGVVGLIFITKVILDILIALSVLQFNYSSFVEKIMNIF